MFVDIKSTTTQKKKKKNHSTFLFCFVCMVVHCACVPSVCECVNYGYLCVYVCVCAYTPADDCCNNRQQSCKVGGSPVNNTQTAGHNPPVTHSK